MVRFNPEHPMKRLALAAAVALTALPAAAGGFGFDLPRLDFPAPGTDGQTTRGCQSLAAPCTGAQAR